MTLKELHATALRCLFASENDVKDLKAQIKLLEAQMKDARQSWFDREGSLVNELNLLKGKTAVRYLEPIDKKELGKEVHEMQKFGKDEQENLMKILVNEHNKKYKKKSETQKLADDINENLNNEQWGQDNDN